MVNLPATDLTQPVRIEWEVEVKATADEVRAPPHKEGERPAVEEAASFLVGLLNGGRGARQPLPGLITKERQITPRWVHAARVRARVTSKRVGFGPGAPGLVDRPAGRPIHERQGCIDVRHTRVYIYGSPSSMEARKRCGRGAPSCA